VVFAFCVGSLGFVERIRSAFGHGGLSVDRLADVLGVPTLVFVGEFDEVGPELARGHAALIPGARFEIIPGSAHITTWDSPEASVHLVREFLRETEQKLAAARR